MPALLYNMGRALQALNRFPEALDRLEAFQVVAPPALLARVPRLGELIKDLRGRVTTLKVTSSTPGARLLVRSTVMSKLPLATPLRLSAGQAEVEVEAEGYFPFHRTVDLPGGGETTIDARLFSKTTTASSSSRPPPPARWSTSTRRRRGSPPSSSTCPAAATASR